VFALESALSRAYWNGFLKLSFVSCPVALYPATTAAERISFRHVSPAGDDDAAFPPQVSCVIYDSRIPR
jgi:hypothetical protein